MTKRKWIILGGGLALLGFVAAFLIRWMIRLDALSMVVDRSAWARLELDQRMLSIDRRPTEGGLLDLGLLRFEAERFETVEHENGSLIGDLVVDGQTYRIVMYGGTTDVYDETRATLGGWGVDLEQEYPQLKGFGSSALVFWHAWSYRQPAVLDVAVWSRRRMQAEILRLGLANVLHVREDGGSAVFQTQDLFGGVFYITPPSPQWNTGALVEIFSPSNDLKISLVIASACDEPPEEFESRIVGLLESMQTVQGEFHTDEEVNATLEDAVSRLESAEP